VTGDTVVSIPLARSPAASRLAALRVVPVTLSQITSAFTVVIRTTSAPSGRTRHAAGGGGQGGQPLVADGTAARLARAVGAGGLPGHGLVELGQPLARGPEQREHLGPLEGDGHAIGVVLVVVA